MAEPGSRTPASGYTAGENLAKLRREGLKGDVLEQLDLTTKLRQELREKGLKGFRRGGKVKKTGVAKVHKGERVLTAKQAKKPAVRRAVRAVRAPGGTRKR